MKEKTTQSKDRRSRLIAEAEMRGLAAAQRFARLHSKQIEDAVRAMGNLQWPDLRANLLLGQQWKGATRDLQRLGGQVTEAGAALSQMQIDISRAAGRFMRMLGGIGDAIRGPLTLIAELARDWPEEYMRSHPWYWISWLPVWSLAELKKEGGLDRLRDALLQWVRNGEILGRVRESPSLARRAQIIEDAFCAHCKGKWTLSVPALMAQVEGSIRDLGVRVGVSSTYVDRGGRKRWKTVGKVVREISDKPFESLRWFSSVPFTTFLMENFFKERNPIMHGEVVEYGTEGLSANCLLALEEVRKAGEGVERVFAEERDVEEKIVVNALRPALERLANR